MRKCYTHIHWVYITHIYWAINDIKHLLPKEISFDGMKVASILEREQKDLTSGETSAVTAVFKGSFDWRF